MAGHGTQPPSAPIKPTAADCGGPPEQDCTLPTLSKQKEERRNSQAGY